MMGRRYPCEGFHHRRSRVGSRSRPAIGPWVVETESPSTYSFREEGFLLEGIDHDTWPDVRVKWGRADPGRKAPGSRRAGRHALGFVPIGVSLLVANPGGA